MKLLIISEAGLVGSENCKLFAEKGWKVISVDNYMEGKLFGAKGSTKQTMMAFLKDYNIEHYELDIRDESIIPLIKRVDAVIHSGTQPSHSKSIKIPMEDFQINAYGTLFLIEAWRNLNMNAVFVFCSTNKVYGDTFIFLLQKMGEKFRTSRSLSVNGFDETLRMHRCMYTSFRISKIAAGLYTQEYAHYMV